MTGRTGAFARPCGGAAGPLRPAPADASIPGGPAAAPCCRSFAAPVTSAQGEKMRGSLMLGRASSSRCSWWRCPPTRSFSSHVVSGVPGRIAPIDSPSIQGGVCGDPNQYPVLNCPNAQDQVFITRFRVFTNGWHQSAAWSYVHVTLGRRRPRHDGNSACHQSATWNYGSCGNLAGAGAASCQFGSPARRSSASAGRIRVYTPAVIPRSTTSRRAITGRSPSGSRGRAATPAG